MLRLKCMQFTDASRLKDWSCYYYKINSFFHLIGRSSSSSSTKLQVKHLVITRQSCWLIHLTDTNLLNPFTEKIRSLTRPVIRLQVILFLPVGGDKS